MSRKSKEAKTFTHKGGQSRSSKDAVYGNLALRGFAFNHELYIPSKHKNQKGKKS
tara:strand:+ start:232 stop:396 length:165 start_codon:yes stop_codon:yes gene_type:complete